MSHILIHNGLLQRGILNGITMAAFYFAGELLDPSMSMPWVQWSSICCMSDKGGVYKVLVMMVVHVSHC